MVTRLHTVMAVAFRWVLLGLVGGLGAGCASHPPAPVSAASPDYRYLIGPGDNVNIIVWRNPELSMSVPVRPDGMIAGP
jgi:polysaccharide export outer membrane protein